jgi:hypothetical protein
VTTGGAFIQVKVIFTATFGVVFEAFLRGTPVRGLLKDQGFG